MAVGIQTASLKKLSCTNKMVLDVKNVSAVGFSGKHICWESVNFHHEMLSWTNFGLDLGVCIVNNDCNFFCFIK